MKAVYIYIYIYIYGGEIGLAPIMYVMGINILSYLVTGRKIGFGFGFVIISQPRERPACISFFLPSLYLRRVTA